MKKSQTNIKKETKSWTKKFVIVSKGYGEEHYPLHTGFDTEQKARAFAKRKYGSLKGLKIIGGYF